MQEVWKEVVGWEQFYKVSNTGKVWSIKSKRLLTQTTTPKGYKKVAFNIAGCRKNPFVHRLVAEAFLDNPENKPQVNHKNENKLDNRVENLEWMYASQNINYGDRNKKVAEKLSIPVSQYSLDGQLIATFPSYKAVERELGFDNRTIGSCAKGRIKTAYGYVWKIAN